MTLCMYQKEVLSKHFLKMSQVSGAMYFIVPGKAEQFAYGAYVWGRVWKDTWEASLLKDVPQVGYLLPGNTWDESLLASCILHKTRASPQKVGKQWK